MCIVRNLNIVKGFPDTPIRACLKKMGPREVTFTSIAINNNSGKRTRSRVRLPAMSSIRFAMSRSAE